MKLGRAAVVRSWSLLKEVSDMAGMVKVKKSEMKAPPALREQFIHPMATLRGQMDRLFDEFAGGWHVPSLRREFFDREPFRTPLWTRDVVDVRFDLSETDKVLEMTVELPGIDEKDVELVLNDGVLTLKGEKRVEKEEKEKDYYLSERRYGAFSRSLRLPESVDTGKIEATFDKGVLKIVVPKRAEAKAKKTKIAITAK
jgi:HSP20 family protein